MFQGAVKGYLSENWGIPFIAGALLLLFVAAAFWLLNFFSFSDIMAVFAFAGFAIGVVLQFICFLKYDRPKTDMIQ